MIRFWGLIIIAALSLLFAVLTELRIRRDLRSFLSRPCMGTRWRRRFPSASKDAIREFLNIFADAFGFEKKKQSFFSPGDKLMDIYRAIYPPGNPLQADNLEFESIAIDLRGRYSIDFEDVFSDDLTLGNLFESAIAKTRNDEARAKSPSRC